MRIGNLQNRAAFTQNARITKRNRPQAKQNVKAKQDTVSISKEARQAQTARKNIQAQKTSFKGQNFQRPTTSPSGAGISTGATVQFSERTGVSYSTKG